MLRKSVDNDCTCEVHGVNLINVKWNEFHTILKLNYNYFKKCMNELNLYLYQMLV